MKKLGGYFPLVPLTEEKNDFLPALCPEGGELKFLMSGRCANYLALKDFALSGRKRTAYVPLYTCETVIAPFVKAGYKLKFYDFRKDMTPVFDESVLDEIGIISICGYYGFSRYDRAFVDKCVERGIAVIEDATHSIFSDDGIYPKCDYIVGSLRKWIGVPAGGFAIKTKGSFKVEPADIHEEHIRMRTEGIKRLTELSALPDSLEVEAEREKATELLWDSEMLLRKIFDSQKSDDYSTDIILHFDFEALKKKRRENYAYLLEHCPRSDKYSIVFDRLDESTVPSHFTLYAENRPEFKDFMEKRGVHATTYWPVGPEVDLKGHENAAYIYDHVISLPCDQRFNADDMQYICRALKEYCEI